jgi:hypothetical protein
MTTDGFDPARDRDLRERFARLRTQESARAPGFGAVMNRRRADTSIARALRPLALAAAALLLVTWAARETADPPPPVPAFVAAPAWRSPTDFLLDVPGAELLRTTPRIGRPVSWPASASDPWRTLQ